MRRELEGSRWRGLLCLALTFFTFAAGSGLAPAAITNALVNGNFEMQTGAGESQTVSNWTESFKSANYNDWVKVGNVDVGQFPAAQSNIVNFSNPNGYIY